MADWQDRLAVIAQRNRQEIVNAKLSRREMMRLGLLTSTGSLVLKAGLSARAHAQTALIPPSPAATSWAQPMPVLPIKTPVAVNQLTHGAPDGTTLIDGARRRINHQLCSRNADGTYGGTFPPQKFYETFVREADHKFHPSWAPSKIWGFDGTYPGPRYNAYYGEPIMVRFHNHLPSRKTHVGFGMPEITTHLHNAHTPSESDGNPADFFNSVNDPDEVNPLGFKDQHYPNVYAGYTALNDLRGDPNEALGSLWYHDHTLDFTSQNIYKGLVGVYTLFDHLDTGDETTGLRLPSGEFDVPIMFGDFVFDRDCQPVFDLFNVDGILGDRFCANGVIQPYFNVKPRRYRFRLYNHGPARWYEFALYDGRGFIPFWQISNDGNLLPQAVQKTSVRLSVAERADIIVDFSKIQSSRIYLVNRLKQDDGRGPKNEILNPGVPIIQLNKVGPAVRDDSADPAAAPLQLRPLPDPDFAALLARADKAKKRTFRFDRSNGAWTVNGKLFDPKEAAARIDQESEEVWVIQNRDDGWSHPVHMHFEEHRILKRNGRPIATNTSEYGRKDTIPLYRKEEVEVFMRFRDMKGRYVMHCHNVTHEDAAMMMRFDIV
ncbi:spore coat protein A [Siccirubricoccus deserti]|uniref:Multicopper oxidase domain-containing protein n=1 Tax=Siccirubricoccus deserti TaxID=2013562 RepID=A0A9X0R023_9PROT|nr:multicopper oxidase domain-containing protein [Siccirubricoccus deserti]MBC4016999.1 multicopper oxidase domain-containing protein [Siccirubricoccus deserti]GGC55934.1 spore coat protein A [Siccirubricoccus deserti]